MGRIRKKNVKKDRQKYRNSLADHIDILLRKCNQGQSFGIPIGPDTSRVAADIISSYVDKEVTKDLSINKTQADRLQDDWLIGCNSYDQSKRVLATVRRAYSELGLDIHGGKTSIVSIHDDVDTPWPHHLHVAAKIHGQLQNEGLRHFCEAALDLQKDKPDESVIRYSLRMVEDYNPSEQDNAYFQTFLLRALISDRRSIDLVSTILIRLRENGYQVYHHLIKKRMFPLIEGGISRREHFEVAWALFLIRELDIPLDIESFGKKVQDIDSSVWGLLLIDLYQRNLVKSLPLKKWEERIANESHLGPLWLLAYEGVRQGWLQDKMGVIANSSFLKPMFDHNIQFYDAKRGIGPLKKIKKRKGLKGRRKVDLWSFMIENYI